MEEYVPMDRHHDNFYERFMEQRFLKLNNFEELSMEDSLPFPIEPLRRAPITLPEKRISNNSSGVNSPAVPSPAMSITPDNLQPYLIASTSRMNPPSGPLTPIQQFLNTIRKSEAKERKYNRPQAYHPDSQLVLRTRTRQNINSKHTTFVYLFHSFLFSGTHQLSIKFSVFLYQITITECHKTYPNCFWHVPPEWFGLNFNSALLTKVYWN